MQDMIRAIAVQRGRLARQDVNQYLSFKNIFPLNFEYIDRHRSQLGAVRFTYYPDINTLIIKVPTTEHEIAHNALSQKISAQITAMNIDIDQFLSLGAARYVGPTASEKEADSSFKNPIFRPRHGDWPTLVIESGGQVQIVLLIKVARNIKRMVFEKYVPERVYPYTRAQASTGPNYRPALVSTTEVYQGATPPYAQGPPIIFEFDRVIGRQPISPEGDIQLGHAKLLLIAHHVFPP
ncbi:hypothetical protein BDV26DRAFT_282721 [Aspergillus bertholletiae]|uniref:Uncharacterized protein n=1 Tax=Aspergillus bertholletiae TaxID=1226010 RepID=A0A5N7B335_9EURO|nr:hypothetical protein BDV26DRAFT_282721 [Aspergillus bertholletiae]